MDLFGKKSANECNLSLNVSIPVFGSSKSRSISSSLQKSVMLNSLLITDYINASVKIISTCILTSGYVL